MSDKKGPAAPRYLQPNYEGMLDRSAPTLNRLGALYSFSINLESFKALLIRTARNEGATWDEVAARLGVTRQAVQKRYGADE
jgi:hypothetical protein